MESAAAREIRRGVKALTTGDTEAALARFQAAIAAASAPAARPWRAEALRRRGQIYFDLGHLHAAIDDLTAALDLDACDARALQTRALVRLALKNPTGALADAEAALALDGSDPASYQILGTAQRRANQIDAAIASLTRATRLYLDRGDTEKSRQCLAQVDRLKPRASAVTPAVMPAATPTNSAPSSRPRDFYRQTIERAESGDAAGALADLEWVLKNGEPDAEALCCRGAIYSTLGKFREALTDFARALKADDSDDTRRALAYGGRGRARMRLEDPQGAVSDLSRAIEIDGSDAALYVSRGAAYRALGNDSAALADFDRAIEVDPGSGRIYLERGMLYARQEELAKAAADYQEAAERFCEREAWDDYRAALDKAAKLRQPRGLVADDGETGSSDPQAEPQANPQKTEQALLAQKLRRLVGGHWEIAERLLASAREQVPGMPEVWYLRAVIAHIEGGALE
ncbi:MAG: tetratricopeptide repeat protein [Geitlerinemataceae cyanobacterium]